MQEKLVKSRLTSEQKDTVMAIAKAYIKAYDIQWNLNSKHSDELIFINSGRSEDWVVINWLEFIMQVINNIVPTIREESNDDLINFVASKIL